MSAEKTYSVDQSSEEEELERNELITEKAIEEMSNEVTKALALQRPIMYETYNICESVDQSKLAKFSIRTQQKICAALELDVTSMTGKCKQPYMEIIEGVVARCGCKTSRVVVRLIRICRDSPTKAYEIVNNVENVFLGVKRN